MTVAASSRLRRLIYVAGFFATTHLVLPLYIGSSFLNLYLTPTGSSWVYVIAAGGGIFALTKLPGIIRRQGLRRTNTTLVLANIIILIVLAAFGSPALLIAAFILFQVLTLLIHFTLDLYLEAVSDDRHTGEIRGLYLTLNNLGWVISPVITGLLVVNNSYGRVYLLSLLTLLPVLFLVRRGLNDPPVVRLPALNWRRIITPHVSKILVLDFILNFFYAVMVIYLPLYLHQKIGLSWPTIGAMLTVMLVPFLLLEWPLGRLADRVWGEKEILCVGLVIAGVFTILLPAVATAGVIGLAAVLFMTRVGASSVEIMKESYLFKQISAADTGAVSLSRATYPLAYILAPLLASIFLVFFPMAHLFTALGAVMFLGLPVALSLKDTR